MSTPERAIERHIFDTFAEVAAALGYSPLHGKIIAALLVHGKPMSLQELAEATGYSASMVSLSLDLLEVLNIIKKIKKTADRKLYIEFQGDLLGALKNAIAFRVERSIRSSLADFAAQREKLGALSGPDKERALSTLGILEEQLQRLERYVTLLAKIKLP